MAKPIFEIKTKMGWKKLRDVLEEIQNAINERCPLASDTVDLDERSDGLVICVRDASSNSSSEEAGAGAAGSSGTPVAIYGARDGAPAIFHLLQSSAPTAP